MPRCANDYRAERARRFNFRDANLRKVKVTKNKKNDDRRLFHVLTHPAQQEYPLHRLVLSRSPYFRALMRGPWADAASSRLTLDFDDGLIDDAAVEVRATGVPTPRTSWNKFVSDTLNVTLVATKYVVRSYDCRSPPPHSL